MVITSDFESGDLSSILGGALNGIKKIDSINQLKNSLEYIIVEVNFIFFSLLYIRPLHFDL